MKLTRRQQQILDALKRGERLWRYSTSNTAYLIANPNSPEPVRRCVLDALEKSGLIEEDFDQSFYRASSGSDIVYKVTDKGGENAA